MNVASNITVNNITILGIVNAVGAFGATANAGFGNVAISNTATINTLNFTTANGQTLSVTGTATMNRAAGNIISQMEEISIALSLILG